MHDFKLWELIWNQIKIGGVVYIKPIIIFIKKPIIIIIIAEQTHLIINSESNQNFKNAFCKWKKQHIKII